MSYARARRHHRVAQKENEQMAQMAGGVFITAEKRNRIIIMAVAAMLLLFVKGLVLGYIAGRNSKNIWGGYGL